MHCAAVYGNCNLVDLLLARGATVNMRDGMWRTPLHMAASAGGNAKMVSLLLERGADVSARDIYGQTPLHLAARYGNPMMVSLIMEGGASVNAVDTLGNTPIENTFRRREGYNVVGRLLSGGANFSPIIASFGIRSREVNDFFHWAVESGRVKIVKMLLEKGVDVDSRDDRGRTSLHKARWYKNVVSLLLENGANPSIKDAQGRTILEVYEYGPAAEFLKEWCEIDNAAKMLLKLKEPISRT